MMNRRLRRLAVVVALAGTVAWVFYDPPWVDRTTTGLRASESGPDGVVYQWTNGHAAFYVPRTATQLALRVSRGDVHEPGTSVVVRVRVDDFLVSTTALEVPGAWTTIEVPLPSIPTRRRTRRVDLGVSRTASDLNYGVQLRPIEWR